MKKYKKLFLTVLSVFLLLGSFGVGTYANPAHNNIADGGGGARSINRTVRSGGGGTVRPWMEATGTIGVANRVRTGFVEVIAHDEGVTSSRVNFRYLPNSTWRVGESRTTMRVTADQNRVMIRARFRYRSPGDRTETYRSVPDITRTW